jgi:hypothetical protein
MGLIHLIKFGKEVFMLVNKISLKKFELLLKPVLIIQIAVTIIKAYFDVLSKITFSHGEIVFFELHRSQRYEDSIILLGYTLMVSASISLFLGITFWRLFFFLLVNIPVVIIVALNFFLDNFLKLYDIAIGLLILIVSIMLLITKAANLFFKKMTFLGAKNLTLLFALIIVEFIFGYFLINLWI